MIKDITHFRLECTGCGKYQDLPHNPSLQRVEVEAEAFFWGHQGQNPEFDTKPKCPKDCLFIRTFLLPSASTGVAESAAKVAEAMH